MIMVRTGSPRGGAVPLLILLSLFSTLFVAQRMWQNFHDRHLLRIELQELKRELEIGPVPALKGPLLSQDTTPTITPGTTVAEHLPHFQGQLDSSSQHQVSGWACSNNPGARHVHVLIYVDSHLLTTVEAAVPRNNGQLRSICNRSAAADGTVDVGFVVPLPPLPPGVHKLQAFARDANMTGKLELGRSPLSLTVEHTNKLQLMRELAQKDQAIREKSAHIATLTRQLELTRPSKLQTNLHGARVPPQPPRNLESGAAGSLGEGGGAGEDAAPLLGFVGINSGPSMKSRRNALRKSWLPTGEELSALERVHGLRVRFVVGYSNLAAPDSTDAEVDAELAAHGDVVRVRHQEVYSSLTDKTMLFFSEFSQMYPADFYVKADDDIYLNLAELAGLLRRHHLSERVYIGCMKHGVVINDRRYKWYEPEWARFGTPGNNYYQHATGQIYALSAAVAGYIRENNYQLHRYSNEDTTIGAIMLGLKVDVVNERHLCCHDCKQQTEYNMCIAVWQWTCNGVCDLEENIQATHKACTGKS